MTYSILLPELVGLGVTKLCTANHNINDRSAIFIIKYTIIIFSRDSQHFTTKHNDIRTKVFDLKLCVESDYYRLCTILYRFLDDN